MKNKITFLFLLIISTNLFCQELKIGDIAPDIVLKSPEGKEYRLSDLRGKMVLIDYWAAWCAPCRKENPEIVETYKKYKDSTFKNGEGFTVFSVSLDKKQYMWEGAIKADNLLWQYHVSDLMGWKSKAAKLYNISTIPTNYLINGKGEIVAKNLRGTNLAEKLKKLEKRKTFLFW